MFSAQTYGPWAVITGGSEGVGAAFAQRLASSGINLVLIARREGPLAETASRIRAESGVEVRTLPLDVSAPDMLDQVKAITDDVEIGFFVSNIGSVFVGGPYERAKPEKIARSVLLNPYAQALLSHHFGKKMVERGRGGMIFVGSMAGNAGSAMMAIYGATKAFEQNLAEALWAEWTPKGVDVLYMVLGATDTPKRASLGYEDPADLIIQSSDEVARQGLDNIQNGPVHVPAHLQAEFQRYCSMPRREAAAAMRDLMMGFDQSRK
jgi:short-subunit dehydrogenase